MNLMCIGAHPDDAEVFAGGLMVLFARAGHRVLAISLTNGDVGHYEMSGGVLAKRRAEEARVAAWHGGYESRVLDIHDGELVPDLHLRKEIVRMIRSFQADIVITHRSNDYHPDHRYASQIVQDAAFMVTVPHFCQDVPALHSNPLFLYFFDTFKFPAAFRADIVVDVSTVMDIKWRLLDAMASQFYEWLPWLEGRLDEVPPIEMGAEARIHWLQTFFGPFLELPGSTYKEEAKKWLGQSRTSEPTYVEAFQICEYGRAADPAVLESLFACALPSNYGVNKP